MFILSNAMGKSASSLLFWYTREIVELAFPENGIQHVREMNKANKFRGVGNFVNPLDDNTVDRLLAISQEQGPIVIKSHSSLSPRLVSLISSGEIIATFAFRDPRDMMLSAIDHHLRRKADGFVEFQGFTNVMDSMDAASWWCEIACRWVESGLATLFRYEDTVSQPLRTIQRIRDTIGVDVDDATLEKIVRDEEARKTLGRNQFNKGAVTRFRDEMTPEEIAQCAASLGHYITRLGYEIEPGKEQAA